MSVLVSWSGGKDSALLLHRLRGRADVAGLLTTVDESTGQVTAHGTDRALIEAQADRLGLPLHTVRLPTSCPNEIYEQRLCEALQAAGRDGVDQVAFGDLFLAEIREYRERVLGQVGLAAVFPLWGQSTDELVWAVFQAGIRAVIACSDTARLPSTYAGREYDAQLVASLPEGVDPCGESGEFHTFVWDSPDFASPIALTRGAVAQRGGFAYPELALAS